MPSQSVRKQRRLHTVKERLLSLNYAVIEFLPRCCAVPLLKAVSHTSDCLGYESSWDLWKRSWRRPLENESPKRSVQAARMCWREPRHVVRVTPRAHGYEASLGSGPWDPTSHSMLGPLQTRPDGVTYVFIQTDVGTEAWVAISKTEPGWCQGCLPPFTPHFRLKP